MTNVIEPLIEQNSLPRLFSQSTCAICLYFNERNESIYSCDHCNPARKTYFCYKHCYAIPGQFDPIWAIHIPVYRVPIKILPGKLHITQVLTVSVSSAGFQMEPPGANVIYYDTSQEAVQYCTRLNLYQLIVSLVGDWSSII